MGKHGPCYHCGVTSTPLWRNGPPEKPILCNACGSRWRTKGTLTNYTPLHSRSEPNDLVDHRVSKVKTISIKNKEVKVLKRKINYDIPEYGVVPLDYNNGLRKVFDEDTSNRSSSGSVISNSESFAQYGSADASDFTGPPQPIVWDSTVPSKKRTCVTRTKPSSVEKLTKDLYTIWSEQQSSCLSGSSEDDLLLETDQPVGSVEFGHGSVLIRHPISIARDEESEASSLSIDQKQNTFPSLVEDTDVKSSTIERIRRDNDELEKMQILAHHNSPLCYIDLQDVLNYEKFASNLTSDEQQQLLTYLPLFGTLRDPVSLKNMFSSAQFKDSMLSFQELLADGVFENSFSWDMKGKSRIDESEVMGGFKGLATDHRMGIKGSQDGQHPKFSGTTVIMKSPKRMVVKSSYDQMELMYSSQNENSSIMLGSSDFDEESLLVDVPFNSSFPQAELLLAEPSTSSCSIYPNLFHP